MFTETEQCKVTDLMSKAMLKEQRVMSIVLTALVGPQEINNYTSTDGEWLDGKHTLFVPINNHSGSLPPVLVEIQNVVDNAFVRRLNQYCTHLYDQYNVEPIVLTICIKETQIDLASKFSNTPKGRFLRKLPSDFWAKDHYIMTPVTINDYLDDRDSNTDDDSPQPLPALAALGYVFIEQNGALFGMQQYKEDPNVMLLYQVAQHDIQYLDVVKDITQVQMHFKRILEAAHTSGPEMKRIRSLANDGVLYAGACLQKYRQQPPEESTEEPQEEPSKKRTRAKRLGDMKYAATFKEEYLKCHKRMNWEACYEKGSAEGYFTKFKDCKTLKNTFNEVIARSKK